MCMYMYNVHVYTLHKIYSTSLLYAIVWQCVRYISRLKIHVYRRKLVIHNFHSVIMHYNVVSPPNSDQHNYRVEKASNTGV